MILIRLRAKKMDARLYLLSFIPSDPESLAVAVRKATGRVIVTTSRNQQKSSFFLPIEGFNPIFQFGQCAGIGNILPFAISSDES